MSETLLLIENLKVEVEGRTILNGLSLKINAGEIHAIMGPNGSGKSTLAYALMGKPGYEVAGGSILHKGQDITGLSADERARRRIFLAFQYPTEVTGVSVVNFLRTAYNAVYPDSKLGVLDFRKYLQTKMDMLGVTEEMIHRYINAGFSGGERKRSEVLQMAVLNPELAILDETDTGLDIDALKEVSAGVMKVHDETRGILLITHYQRLLNYVEPHFVHVLIAGKLQRSGGKELAQELEAKGYEQFRGELGIEGELTDEATP